MNTALFIVSYRRDFQWLPYLFKSIGRHCTGFSEIVLAVPNCDIPLLKPMGLTKERIVGFDETIDGHMAHLCMKLTADLYTDCDTIVHIDSDCVFRIPVTPEYFMKDGKPMLIYTPFEIRDGKEWPSHWRKETQRALSHEIGVETMRRHCCCYWRDTYKNLQDYIQSIHGKTWWEYLAPYKRGTFSEFVTLGNWAYYHEPDRYTLINADDAPPRADHQFWSFHGTRHPEVQAKLRELDLL